MKRLLLWGSVLGTLVWQWQRQQERANAVPVKNKVVIITGASAGIGKATARVFSAQGAHTVLVARRANLLAELQEELQREFDTQVLTVTADLTNDDDIQRVVDETLAHFGRIDVLVNNAGLTMGGYLEEHDEQSMQTMLHLNLTSVIQLTKAVLPTMKAQHSGTIVNVSSGIAESHMPGEAAYAATKSGMNGFSNSLRRELKASGVHVAVVSPGYTTTGMIEHLDGERMEAAGMLPPGVEVQTPDYVASNIVAAVRYKRAYIRLGGPLISLYSLFARLFPGNDALFSLLVDFDETVEAARQLGTR